MSKKVAIVEDCFECPFFIDNEWEVVKKSKCKKMKLEGNQIDLFNVCCLPNYEENFQDDVYNWEGELQKTDDGFWRSNK